MPADIHLSISQRTTYGEKMHTATNNCIREIPDAARQRRMAIRQALAHRVRRVRAEQRACLALLVRRRPERAHAPVVRGHVIPVGPASREKRYSREWSA
jgi:hypothetical protein